MPDPVTNVTDIDNTEGQTPELYLSANNPGYVGVPRYVSPAEKTYAPTEDQPFSFG